MILQLCPIETSDMIQHPKAARGHRDLRKYTRAKDEGYMLAYCVLCHTVFNLLLKLRYSYPTSFDSRAVFKSCLHT